MKKCLESLEMGLSNEQVGGFVRKEIWLSLVLKQSLDCKTLFRYSEK